MFFSGRRLKPGSWEQFRRAWDPGEEGPPAGVVAVYHARNVKDENEVISFGIFDIDRDSLDVVRGTQEEEAKRQEEIAKYVHDTPLEGIYAAVTRRTLDGAHPGGWVPEQKVTVEEALRAYTVGGAYAGFDEA